MAPLEPEPSKRNCRPQVPLEDCHVLQGASITPGRFGRHPYRWKRSWTNLVPFSAHLMYSRAINTKSMNHIRIELQMQTCTLFKLNQISEAQTNQKIVKETAVCTQSVGQIPPFLACALRLKMYSAPSAHVTHLRICIYIYIKSKEVKLETSVVTNNWIAESSGRVIKR